MERNKAAANQSQVRPSNQLLPSFPPFPVRHPGDDHGTSKCIRTHLLFCFIFLAIVLLRCSVYIDKYLKFKAEVGLLWKCRGFGALRVAASSRLTQQEKAMPCESRVHSAVCWLDCFRRTDLGCENDFCWQREMKLFYVGHFPSRFPPAPTKQSDSGESGIT